jgi:hypothetical protein
LSLRRPRIVALAATTVALASTSALAADDWAAVVGGGADDRMTRRLEANVRTIPGTDTRFLIGGFVQLDGLFTRDKQTGDEQATFLPTATPFGPADSDQRASIRQSQLNWLSYTPSPIGTVTVRALANLFSLDYDGATTFSLWQLYAGIGDTLVVGKAYSTFVDSDALPTTLDFNGPAGATSIQQWLVRASLPLGAGWTLAGGVEDSQARHRLGGPSFDARTRARRPDLAAHLRYDFERGHAQVAALSRRVELTATTPAGTFARNFDGSGIAISGSLATFGDDSVIAEYVTGKGIGRYFNDAVSVTGATLGKDGRLDFARGSGATLYYQRFWTPDWMTVAGASTQWASDAGTRPPNALNRVAYASANLIHRFAPALLGGVEGLWGRATRVDGISATNARLQVSLRVLID